MPTFDHYTNPNNLKPRVTKIAENSECILCKRKSVHRTEYYIIYRDQPRVKVFIRESSVRLYKREILKGEMVH